MSDHEPITTLAGEEPAVSGPAGAAAPRGPQVQSTPQPGGAERHPGAPAPAEHDPASPGGAAAGSEHEPSGTDPAAAPAGSAGPTGTEEGPSSEAFVSAGEAGEASVAEAEVTEDLNHLARLAGERDQYLALAQRTQADFENFRKRAAREARTAEGRGVARVVRELLPALDNLERAVSHAAQDDPLLEGIRLVQADLASALTRLGVESFSPGGETFDPSEHEAVAQQPVEGAQSGTVVEVYQAGYRLDGSVLRPARVVVAA